ncbi:MAG TPA: fibronectin type III domain-containing protein [Spirillospora sp.]|nr:fibronectin type III domain-containing protein [Spirillospora sp.]
MPTSPRIDFISHFTFASLRLCVRYFLPIVWLLAAGLVTAQVPLPTTPPNTSGYIRAPRLGITFINSTDSPLKEERYYQALFLGAGWNRWPLYRERVELIPGQYNWSAYDLLVSEDLRHGLNINAIFLGQSDIPGLTEPVFTDGSDTPGPGKFINPGNSWAAFVYAAVNRYKPGGELAQQQGWPSGQGIRVWEAWNEPDIPMFWTGSVTRYVRLLKVTYLAAHYADPGAQVMFGGLAYSTDTADNFLARALAIIAQDGQAANHNWYFDLVAAHSYSYARRSGAIIQHVREVLAAHGLSRPIWLNETGVPVWNDYPGPTWAANDPGARVLRATTQQQAAFIIQSAAYAWAAGADVVMVHQLYDDCGNQPGGTNFPPHDGGLCLGGGPCWGDAHGLFRNTADAACFSQHPLPGTPRPAAGAFRLLAEIFGTGPFEPVAVQLFDERGVVITFNRPSLRERVHVAWNRSLEPVILDLPADGQIATLYALDGRDYTLIPEADLYRVTLPPATRDDFPFLAPGDGAAVGGPPVIIVEQATRDQTINPALPQFEPPEGTPHAPLAATPGPVTELIRPTVDPAQDTTAPTTRMNPLPVVSPPTFTVSWGGQDDSGIASYLVWVRVDGGVWQPWLEETTATQASFTGEPGRRYEFAVWAVDLAGNWSLNTELSPQAVTSVQ